MIAVSLLALAATLAGGYVILRYRALPRELLAFSAGTLLAIGVLDLTPYSIGRLGPLALLGIALGYGVLYLWHTAANPLTLPHTHSAWEEHGQGGLAAGDSGLVAAGALLLHKLFDGALLGIGLTGGASLGPGIAAAVVLHSFCDGVNTVTLVRRSGRDRTVAWLFLAANGLAPLVAILGIDALGLSRGLLDWSLTFVAGTFVYIAVHDLLPAAFEEHDHRLTLSLCLALGILLAWGLTTQFT